MATTELDVVKISELPESTSANTSDVFPVTKGSTTYKMSYATLKSAIEDDIEATLDGAVAAATQQANQYATNAGNSATDAAESAAEATDWAEHLTIDSALSETSTNPVQNKAVAGEISEIKNDIEQIEGGASLPVNSASGNPAVFSDGADGVEVKDLVLNLEPHQNLNGYDYPWVGGAGKNKWSLSASYTSTAAQYFEENTALVLQSGSYMLSYTPSITTGQIVFAFKKADNTTILSITVNNSVHKYNFTLSENCAKVSVYTNSALTISNVMIESGSTATSYEPYSNICPISGYTAVNVTRAGKNLLNATDNPSISVAASAQTALNFGKLYLDAGTEYIISCIQSATLASNTRNTFRITNVSTGTSVYESSGGNYHLASGYREYRYTPSVSGEYYIGMWVQTPNAAVSYTSPMVRLASVADSTYESYTAQTYPIIIPSSAGTVYGGTLDVTSGELVVDRASVDMGTLNWSYNSTYAFFAYNLTGQKFGGKLLCSIYKYGGYSSDSAMTTAERGIYNITTNAYIKVKDTSYTSASTFKAAMSGTQLVYELATPIEYTLTPTEVTTLLGNNTIWMDADGTLDIDYRADVQLYVDERDKRIKALIAPVEDSYTASRNYTVGSYVIVDSTLYRVTTAIASGGTITLNSNVTATTVMAEIMALA